MTVQKALKKKLRDGVAVSTQLGKLIADVEAANVEATLGISDANREQWLQQQKQKMRDENDEVFQRAVFDSKSPGTMLMMLKEGIEFDSSVKHDAEITVALLQFWAKRMRDLWGAAVCSGDVDQLDTWMSLGVDVMWHFTSSRVRQSLPAVFHAAANDQVKVLSSILGHVFCLEDKDQQAATPLCYAVRNEAFAAVKELCEAWADPTVQFACAEVPLTGAKLPLIVVAAWKLRQQPSHNMGRIVETLIAWGALDGLQLSDDGQCFDCAKLTFDTTDGGESFSALASLPRALVAGALQRRRELEEPDFEFEQRVWKQPPTVKRVKSAAELEKERLEVERLETERQAAIQLEQQRLAEAAERAAAEQQRLEAERREAERLEAERLEAERVEAERAEAERLEKERQEAERREQEAREAEQRRLAAQKLQEDELAAMARAFAEEPEVPQAAPQAAPQAPAAAPEAAAVEPEAAQLGKRSSSPGMFDEPAPKRHLSPQQSAPEESAAQPSFQQNYQENFQQQQYQQQSYPQESFDFRSEPQWAPPVESSSGSVGGGIQPLGEQSDPFIGSSSSYGNQESTEQPTSQTDPAASSSYTSDLFGGPTGAY